jgi:hypothetical protein
VRLLPRQLPGAQVALRAWATRRQPLLAKADSNTGMNLTVRPCALQRRRPHRGPGRGPNRHRGTADARRGVRKARSRQGRVSPVPIPPGLGVATATTSIRARPDASTPSPPPGRLKKPDQHARSRDPLRVRCEGTGSSVNGVRPCGWAAPVRASPRGVRHLRRVGAGGCADPGLRAQHGANQIGFNWAPSTRARRDTRLRQWCPRSRRWRSGARRWRCADERPRWLRGRQGDHY